MNVFRILAQDPYLRAISLMIALLGVVNSCLYPYMSHIAVHEIGLAETSLAVVLAVGSAVAVSSAVLFGMLADIYGSRRAIAIASGLSLVLALVLMTVFPSVIVFVLAQALFVPIGGALFGQIFALNNLASQRFASEREGIQATVRAMMSAGFLVMLLFWTWAIGGQHLSVMATYPIAAIGAIMLLLLLWRTWPKRGQEPWNDQPSGLNLSLALKELAEPPVALRLLALGAMGALPMLYLILTPLLFEQSPVRSTAEVALMVGLVAGFEVPSMLILPRYVGRFGRPRLIVFGAMAYALFVILLALWSDHVWLIWLLPALAGLAAGPFLTLPIGYWQDLFQGRPGTAAALMALQKLASDLIAASVFGLGAFLGTYVTVAVTGAIVAICGGALLLYLDRSRAA